MKLVTVLRYMYHMVRKSSLIIYTADLYPSMFPRPWPTPLCDLHSQPGLTFVFYRLLLFPRVFTLVVQLIRILFICYVPSHDLPGDLQPNLHIL